VFFDRNVRVGNVSHVRVIFLPAIEIERKMIFLSQIRAVIIIARVLKNRFDARISRRVRREKRRCAKQIARG